MKDMKQIKVGDIVLNPEAVKKGKSNNFGEVKEIHTYEINGEKIEYAWVKFQDFEESYLTNQLKLKNGKQS